MASADNAQLKIEFNSIDNVSATAEKVAKKVDSYQRAVRATMTKSGGVLKQFGSEFHGFTALVTQFFSTISSSFGNRLQSVLSTFSQMGFQLENMALHSRISTQNLELLGYVARQAGLSVEDVASGVQAFQEKMVAGMLGDLQAMKDLFTTTRLQYSELKKMSPEEQFLRVAEVIQQIPKEYQSKISVMAFGTDKLLPLLKLGTDGIKAKQEEGRQAGVITSPEAIENSKKLARAWNEIKTIFNGMRVDFLSTMTETVGGAFQKVKGFLTVIKEWSQENPQTVKAITLITAGLATLAVAGTSVIAVLGGASLTLSLLGAGFSTFFLSFPSLIAGGIVALAGFTGTFGKLKEIAVGAFNMIAETLRYFFSDSIKLLLSGDFEGAWKQLWDKIQLQFVDVTVYITDVWIKGWEFLSTTFGTVGTWLVGAVKDIVLGVVGFFSDLINGLFEFCGTFTKEIGGSSESWYDLFMGGWYGIQEGVIRVFYGIQTGFMKMVSSLKKVWISFRKELQAGVNYIYGKAMGMSDEEIGEMTNITDSQFDQQLEKVGKEERGALKAKEAERDTAIETAKSGFSENIRKHNEAAAKRQAEADARRNELLDGILARKAKLATLPTFGVFSLPDEKDPGKATSQGKGVMPPNLAKIQDRSTASQNAFQAIFGSGQTEAAKQLEVQRQMLTLITLITENVI
ncbi:MAG: hypothetical protein Q4C70_11685 [Planctomycetia bacterium]|nr:hypothetical protein [Planctomycetia bacterium]